MLNAVLGFARKNISLELERAESELVNMPQTPLSLPSMQLVETTRVRSRNTWKGNRLSWVPADGQRVSCSCLVSALKTNTKVPGCTEGLS